MTTEDPNHQARHFAEGVSAEVWIYEGEGYWAIEVARDGSRCSFISLDSVKRSVLDLHNQVLQGRGELSLGDVFSDRDCEEFEVRFYSAENARSCVGEIRKALEFIQSETTNKDWHEVPAEIFTSFGKLGD